MNKNPVFYIVLTTLLGLTQALQSATVLFTSFDGNGNQSGLYSVSIDDSGLDIKYNFTFTGDIDGCGAAGITGAANDTFSFTLVDTYYEGSTFTGDTTTSGALTLGSQVDNAQEPSTSSLHFGSNDNGSINNGYLDVGNSFELSIANISYTRGETGVTENATFNGFNSVEIFYAGDGSDVEYLVGTSGTSVAKNDNSTTGRTVSLGGAQTALFTQTDSDGGNSRLRVRDLNFSFEVDDSHIPEPSSALLIGLSLFAFTFKRGR